MEELIKTIPAKESVWIENVNLRREEYKKIISRAQREFIIRKSTVSRCFFLCRIYAAFIVFSI